MRSLLITALILIASVVVTTAPTPASAQTAGGVAFDSLEARMGFAQAAFMYGDYAGVVDVLAPAFLPTPPDMAVDDLLTVYTWLGVAAYFEGDESTAAEAFLNLLTLDPSFELDTLVYPPDVMYFFEQVRDENAEIVDPPEPDEVGGGTTVYLESRYREQSLWVSMLPFGYGFFTSEREVTGLAYLFGEGLLLGTSLSLGLAHELGRDDNGYVRDEDRSRRIRNASTATGYGFLALAIANAIHGAVTHEQVGSVEFRTLTEPPPELTNEPRSGSGWRFRFVPLVLP